VSRGVTHLDVQVADAEGVALADGDAVEGSAAGLRDVDRGTGDARQVHVA